ncbi:response regulator [Geoalkalibacter halelectricus]|uniref:Response regulator n=1 Tax=Geoalkalibacter halelectricus TaxID=2847045 RepID=A0ABY5ZHN2_9BACT|nr:response regulator [Geoalkalibacter halelectricus]MDO3377764.1 response regulator [Geoalkalibacter halelectricus]UWZ78642.1 response regulator [Geoalkalibacter halelectricus]
MVSAPPSASCLSGCKSYLPDLSGRRVLVVADDEESRELLEEMILLWGGEFLGVQNGAEALQQARLALAEGRRFDLIIIDLNRTCARGAAAARTLAGETALSATPILFLNGEPCPPPESAALPGAFCVEKPLRLVDLQDAVSKVLCGRVFNFPRRTKAWLTTGKTPISQRILLVEDSPVNQKLMQTLLGKRGHQLATAENGREALELLAGGTFDLILVDMQMPVMDGIELTQIIRRGDGGLCDPNIPIIGTTAHAYEEEREQFRAAGLDHCLAKPFKIQELLALVERYARQEITDDQ